jgi:hypothetical protein
MPSRRKREVHSLNLPAPGQDSNAAGSGSQRIPKRLMIEADWISLHLPYGMPLPNHEEAPNPKRRRDCVLAVIGTRDRQVAKDHQRLEPILWTPRWYLSDKSSTGPDERDHHNLRLDQGTGYP